ncbi:MAG TPA: ABC transporter ATP-binding protein [Pirellulales bacterium]|nr:ABC transporter ATP-binding protein [Pirellulales bacterium]
MNYLPRIFGYVRPYWRLAAASIALIFLGGIAGLLVPWPLAFLIDNVLGSQPMPDWLAWLVGPLGANQAALLGLAVVSGLLITLLQNGLTVFDNYVNTKLEQRMALDFRSDLFQHAQRLSMAFHDRRRSGMLIYAINSQADAVPGLVMAVPPMAQSAITLGGMFWILLTLDPVLAGVSLTVVPFLFYSVRYYATHIQDRLLHVRNMECESLSIVHEAISMLRVIVAFGREDHEYRRFREQGELAIDGRVKLTVRQTLFSLAVNMTTAAGTALVLWVGASHVLAGKLQVGQLLVVLAYIASVYKPLEAITHTAGTIQEKLVNLRLAFHLLGQQPEIADAHGAIALGRARGDVEFAAVGFSYQGRAQTLCDISFAARAGQVVAIVGPTGAGKTTLISLIPRFYDQQQGHVRIDGLDIRQVTLRSLREQISLVLQEPLLFSGTIADNIRYGRLDATMDEVIEAARSANAHDFIMRLPHEYQTELGERGAKLSGGERQRLCIARAFLKDAPILILDEPTSAIDSKTEAVILDALDRLMVGRTTFLIAHRLSTVRRADLILVMDGGRLVERGTHDELLRRGGLYKQLHDLQTADRRRRLHGDMLSLADAAEVPA